MTDKPIADLVREIEELDQKATPGPWEAGEPEHRMTMLSDELEAMIEEALPCRSAPSRVACGTMPSVASCEEQRRLDPQIVACVFCGLRPTVRTLVRRGVERCASQINVEIEAPRLHGALRNAWPRLRKVLAERDSLKAENEKLREVAGVAKAASRYCHGKIGERAWNDQHCGYQNDDDGAWIYGCQDCASWGPLDAALAELEKR